MMEGGKYLFVVVLFVGAVRCQQTFQEVVPNDLSNPDRCYDSTIDAFFSVGSVWWRPAQCNRLTCQRSDDLAFLNINGVRCEQFTEVPANCKLTKANLVALFPACCPKLVCAEIPIDVEAMEKPAIVPVDMADKEPEDIPAPVKDTPEDPFVKPPMVDDKVSSFMTNENPTKEVNKDMGAQEAAEQNTSENVESAEMMEEPAVVLASNQAEEVIPATLTINVADESKPEDDSVSQENMSEEAKLPAELNSEPMIPEAIVEETKQPEEMAEEAKIPDSMDEDAKIPDSMAEDAKIPDSMVEETKVPVTMAEDAKIPNSMADETTVPETMAEGANIPDSMAEESKVPEEMDKDSKVPEAMAEENKFPNVMAEENNVAEAVAEENNDSDAINEETKVPAAMAEETNVPDAMNEETKQPEAMDEEIKKPEEMAEAEEIKVPDAAAQETNLPEVMDETNKKPEAMDEIKPDMAEKEKPFVMEEKPVAPVEETVSAVDIPEVPLAVPAAAPEKQPEPIYNGGVGLGIKCGPPTYQSCQSHLECREKICQYPIKVIPIQSSQLMAEVEKPTKIPTKKPVKEVMTVSEEKVQEAPETTEETTTVTEEKPLLPGYERHPTGNYKFNKRMVTWTRAKAICESEGTHLAIVNSEEESKILIKMFDRYPENYWQPKYRKIVFASVGFNDMEKEGEYKTIFGEPLSSTGFERFWRKNEPNNLGASKSRPGEDCGAIHRNGGLNDFFCSIHLPFICEQ